MTTLEREILVSTLKLAQEGNTLVMDISKEAKVAPEIARKVLRKNSKAGILELEMQEVQIDKQQRLRLAVRAIELGSDVEKVCSYLRWQEFEDLSIRAFESEGFSVRKHFRFRCAGRRWEIDILALKGPLVISADCKQWHHGWAGASSIKAASCQAERTKALTDATPALNERIGIVGWKNAYFIPVILSLSPSMLKLYEGVPLVPVLQLGSFLQDIPTYVDEVLSYRKVFSPTCKTSPEYGR